MRGTEMMLKQAAILVNILHFRLTSHLDCRLNESPDKKKYWVVDWVQRDILNCAEIMIYFKMVKADVSCIDESKTLLTGPESYLPIVNTEKKL